MSGEAAEDSAAHGSDDGARREAIAAALSRLGFISSETAHRDNAAVDVLAALLPTQAEVGVCLSYHDFRSTGTYRFTEKSGVFKRPTTPRFTAPFASLPGPQSTPMPRTEIVLCPQEELLWTASRPRRRAGAVTEDDVTLYSVPFSIVLGATVHDQRKGVLEIWIDAEATLSFRTTPSEVDLLCTYIERAATSL